MKTIKIFTLALLLSAASLPAMAQFKSTEDSICLTNRFLYQEAYKGKQYLDAYEPWKIALQTCPNSTKNLYIQGATILKSKFNATKDAAERNAIIDELMNLYDMRIQYYGEAPMVTARKAFDLEQLGGNARLQQYYGIYAEAMRIGANQLDLAFIERYFDATIKYVTVGHYDDTTLIIDNYDIAADALDAILAATEDSAKKAEVYGVIANIENRFSPFATCEELVKIYQRKFDANPDDVTLLKKITGILSKKNCTKTDLFFSAAEKLYSIEPTPSTAYMMGKMCFSKDKFNDAITYLNDAVKDADPKDLYNMYILLGLSYNNINSYTAARNAYQKAADADETKGEPYRLLAQLYAKGARSIDDGLGGRSAYWAAVDQARKAINVDSSPENVDAANKLISTYSGHFPKQADAFMLDLIDGNSYTVPGWIGVSTTVRTRK